MREVFAGAEVNDFKVDLSVPRGRHRTLHVTARKLRQEGEEDATPEASAMVLLAIEDITQREETERALQELSGRLLQLRDEEQRRIARELHDSTAQKVSALAMNLAVLDRVSGTLGSEQRKALTESQALADECSRELRDLASLLHPPLLDEVGLESALRWYADSFSRRSGIKVSMDLSPRLGRIAHELETTIFRVVQECLSNVQHHSGSPTAAVRIDCEEEAVVLQVTDRGRGMSPESVRSVGPGVGISGMRGRVRQHGGDLKITSDSRGTRVTVTLPIRREGM